MNPSKTEEDLFLHHHPHDLDPPHQILPHHQVQLQSSIPNPSDDPSFSLSEIALFHASSSESPSHSSTDSPPQSPSRAAPASNSNSIPNSTNNPSHQSLFISPEPHISSQFYTFNPESHALMIRCILEQRLATPSEIRAATPRAVLKSWRAVWKDRNEETAYLTAWKRIQDKLIVHVDENERYLMPFRAWLM